MASIAPPPGLKPKIKKIEVISNIASTGDSSGNKKLSNKDFRALLSQPKASSDDRKGNSQKNDERQKKRNARSESYKKWQAKKAKKEVEHGQKYRDRAAERREDVNPDYEHVDIKEYEDVDMEKSKYLGGDVEHTHLVKGLDYALLRKRRGELEEDEEQKMEREYLDIQKRKEKEVKQKQAEIVFVSNIGRRVYYSAIEAPMKRKTSQIETFLPGRMMFEFDVDQNFGSDIPTTLMQSRSDCPDKEERLSGQVSSNITTKIERIISLLSHGSKYGRKGKRKKEKQKKSKKKKFNVSGFAEDESDDDVSKHSDDDQDVNNDERESSRGSRGSRHEADGHDSPDPDDKEDIFGDAGREYECDPDDVEQRDADAQSKYFDDENEVVIENDPLIEEEVKKLTEANEEELKDQKRADTMKEKDKREQDPNYVDVYMECYPSSYGGIRTGFVVDDNSDDEDLSKMDQGRSRVRPWDFNTEGEWEKFNDDREAMPKAAFQFGLKKKDGRQSQGQKIKSQKEKEKDKEQKFERDFNKITSMMKKRQPKEDPQEEKRRKILSGFKKGK